MKYAIYDFDGTLLQAQTVPMILQQWQASSLPKTLFKKIKLSIQFRYVMYRLKIFGIKRETFRAWAMVQVGRLFASLPLETLSQFLDTLYGASKKHLHKKLVKLIQKDRADGFTTILLSGNYDVFLERYREIGFDHIIGTSLFNEQGKMCDPIEIIISDKKPKVIEQRFPSLHWEKVKAYADSMYDLPLLTKAKEAIIVTPDAKLRAYATERQWRILS